jgi:hypothetical protein
VIFNSHMFNAPRFNSEKDVSLNFFTLNEANTCVAHFPSVITTIMDQKVQLINPLNFGELFAA